ncbi:MAG TPA: SIR2 family protein [bacterium]|nr:SIR2 family protein [bacterium]
MLFKDVNVPERLIAANRDGRLVLFAGAGISMSPPSNLPDFNRLAELVSAGTLARGDHEPVDRFLGRLSNRGTKVEARVREIIGNPASQPGPLHAALCAIPGSRDNLRIVTTNFDTHLSNAAEARYGSAIETFSAPALPLGRDFRGIVYLHGSLPRREGLILTDSDFGRAYLADGWATRFLLEMFETFTVLFVGYSHSDVVMQYLARGFVNATTRFAFATAAENDDWTYLGITPVNYELRAAPDEYGAVRDGLEGWAHYARLGLLDHEQRMLDLAAKGPPIDPESIDYLDSVVREPRTLRTFTKHAKTVDWLEWLDQRGHLAPLFVVDGPDDPLATDLAEWIATHFAVAHAKSVFRILEDHQMTLGGPLWFAVGRALAFANPRPAPDLLERWALLLTGRARPEWRTIFLEEILSKGRSPDEAVSQLQLFGYLARPHVALDRIASIVRDDSGELRRLNVEVTLRGDGHELHESWQNFFLPNMHVVHQPLEPMLSGSLEEAHRIMVAAGRADRIWDPMSFRRSAIEPHGQDAHPDPWEILVDSARDLLEWRLKNAPGLASGLIEQWNSAQAPLLRRLAVHGVGLNPRLAADDKVLRVQNENWLHTFALKHEVFHLLEGAFGQASEQVQQEFIAYARSLTVAPEGRGEARPLDDYEKYNVAVWLNHVAPGSKVAADYLAEVSATHPDYGPRDHPDFDTWSGPVTNVTPKSPFSVAELLEWPVVDVVTKLLEFRAAGQHPGEPDRMGMLAALQEMVAASFPTSVAIAKEMIQREAFTSDVWSALMHGWRDGPLGIDQWVEVLDLIAATPGLDQNDRGIADLIDRAADYKGDRADELVARLEQVAYRLLSATDSPSAIVSSTQPDWLTKAINQTGGRLTMVLLKLASQGGPSSPPTLRETTRAHLEKLVTARGNNGTFARIVMASQANYLLALDQQWTREHIVPLFDWDRDATTAEQSWAGFAGWGRWSGLLFDALLPATRKMFSHLAVELKESLHHICQGLAGMAVFSERDPWHGDGWLRQFIRDGGDQAIASWSMDVARAFEELPAEAEPVVWQRWLRDYLADRASGIPKPWSDSELGHVVLWALEVPSQFDAIADVCTHASPPGKLDHFVLHRLDSSGVATTHPVATARLLRHLLRSAEVNFSCDYLFRIADVSRKAGAMRDDLLGICESMARLGCSSAFELRQLVMAPPEATP